MMTYRTHSYFFNICSCSPLAWRLAGYLTMSQSLCIFFFFYAVGLAEFHSIEFQNRLKNKIKQTKKRDNILSPFRFFFNKTNNSVKRQNYNSNLCVKSKSNGNNRIKNTFDYIKFKKMFFLFKQQQILTRKVKSKNQPNASGY